MGQLKKISELEILASVTSGTYAPVVDASGNSKKFDLNALKNPTLKTVNNQSLEGSGNIAISGGKGISGTGGNAEVFNGGSASKASGYYSHAEGYNTIASGEVSHAEGGGTIASGDSSHSEGNATTAQNQSEHAQGQYNKSNKANDTFGYAGNTIHSVGIGTEDYDLKNAFEIMQNGDIYVIGLGGYDGTNAGQSGILSLQEVLGASPQPEPEESEVVG